MTMTGSISMQLQANLQNTRDLGAASVTETLAHRVTVTDGSTANKATQVWGDTRTLAASANEELDLSGTLVNGVGATVALTRIIALMITADAANTNDVVVGGAASAAWEAWAGAAGDVIKVKPGGCLVLTAPATAGYAVAAGSTDKLKIANSSSGTGVTYSILIMGSEAT